jgi:hypothetical protein
MTKHECPATPNVESLLRTAAARLIRCPAGDIASTIIEGVLGTADVDELESLVVQIAGEHGLEGSVHLHSDSYLVRFSRMLPIDLKITLRV